MRTKKCFKCGKRKPESRFYRHQEMADGRLGKCKTCSKSDVKANRMARSEQYAAYERRRFGTARRKAQVKKAASKMRAANPGKYRARRRVATAILSGRLKKLPCDVCGNPASQAHHADYRRPLDVRFLCLAHHRMVHGQRTTTPKAEA